MGEGKCDKGEDCTWAHGEEDIGSVVAVQEPAGPQHRAIGKGGPQFYGGGKPTPMYIPPPIGGKGVAAQSAPKRTICKFWEQGICTQGEACTWAHGYEEIGQPTAVAVHTPVVVKGKSPHAPVAYAGGGCKGGSSSSGKVGFRPTIVAPVRISGIDDRPRQDAPKLGIKRSMCKFWLENACTKGEECTFAHGEHEIGEPIPGDWVGTSDPVPR